MVYSNEIQTVNFFKEIVYYGPYAWPGGYPIYFITADGGALSFAAAEQEFGLILDAIRNPEYPDNDQWRIVAWDINWEDPELYCDQTGARIKSAYAEDEVA